MADTQDDRKRITEELGLKRVELSNQSLLVRRNLDVGRRMSDSLRNHPWGWISLAAIFGWLLSRLPARKKKIYIHAPNSTKRRNYKDGLLLSTWKGVWSIARPLITAYLTKKIAQKAKIPGAKWL